MKSVSLSFLLSLVCALCVLQGQETRGTFSGTVSDASGAAVAGAAIVVTNLDTNTTLQATTNTTGYYEVPLLIAGNYQIVASASGFKRSVRSGLTLGLGQQEEINISLEVGNASEAVTISAESPILDTSTTSSGKVLTTKELMDLPVLANNIIIQARMVPGVQTSGTTQYLTHGQSAEAQPAISRLETSAGMNGHWMVSRSSRPAATLRSLLTPTWFPNSRWRPIALMPRLATRPV